MDIQMLKCKAYIPTDIIVIIIVIEEFIFLLLMSKNGQTMYGGFICACACVQSVVVS